MQTQYSSFDPNTMGTRMKTSPTGETEVQKIQKAVKEIESVNRTVAEKSSERRQKDKKITLTCTEKASSDQWKTLKEKSKVLEVRSAAGTCRCTSEGNTSTQDCQSIPVTALQLDSNGAE